MIINTRQNKNNEQEEKDYFENKKNYIIKKIIDNYKYLLFGIIGVVFIIILVVVLLNTRTEVTGINVQDSSLFYVSEISNIKMEFAGVKKIKKVDYELNVFNKEIIEVATKTEEKNILNLQLLPKSPGKTRLQININNISKNIELIVCNRLSLDVLKKQNIYLTEGEEIDDLFISSFFSECQENIIIKSNDPSVVEVNNKSIKALKAGTTTLYISQGNNIISIDVSVFPLYTNVKEIKINGNYILDFDETYQIEYEVLPEDATGYNIEYTSSNPDIISVSSEGELTANNYGTANIYVTATNNDGSKIENYITASVSSSVSIKSTQATNITVNSATLTANIENLNNKKITEAGIYIWENGKNTPSKPNHINTNISKGIKNINFDTKEFNLNLSSGVKYKFKIYIIVNGRKYTSDISEFTTLSITNLSFSRNYAAVEVGTQYNLPIKVEPSNLTIQPTYTSENTKIATVDSNGIIHGIKTGETIVTASYGDKKASIKVRVVGAVSKSNPPIFYDLSRYNKVSSWTEIKKHMDYIIFRLGITDTINSTIMGVDGSFDEYVSNARKNDIEVGVYYYSKANSYEVARNEANFVLSTLNKYPKGTFALPVFIDYEEQGCPLNATGAKYIGEFCKIIEAGGYYCGAYTYYYMFEYDMGTSVKAIWVPAWTSSQSPPDVPNLGIWQYATTDPSSYFKPNLYGVDSADANKMYINYATHIINSGLNNFK